METLIKKLFDDNYANRGDCEGLEKKVCSFKKVFKKENREQEIRYLPWAVVERIFRGQGGFIDIIEHVHEIKTVTKKSVQDLNNGEILAAQSVESNALFIHLFGSWNGNTEHEYYPIFNSQNATVISSPDALDINTAKQRGMVRLIARLSGIGLWLFEQEEKQFDSNSDNAETPLSKTIIKNKPDVLADNVPTEDVSKTNIKEKPAKITKVKADEAKHVEAIKTIVEEKPTDVEAPIVQEPSATSTVVVPDPEVVVSDEAANSFLKFMVEGKTPPTENAVPTPVEPTVDDSQDLADAVLEVRKLIQLSDGQKEAKAFIQAKGKNLIRELTLSEARELNVLLQGLSNKK